VQVVGYYGTKRVSYQEALAAIFIEGWIFIAISIVGIRQRLIGFLPRYVSLSCKGCSAMQSLTL
jgi:AGZA family xanthine/uracil permease-like MFS transporter